MLIISLFLACANCENNAQSYTQQRSKEHAVLAREHEGDGVSRVPEQRNGLLKDKTPLTVPVEGHHVATHVDRGDECLERATTLCDVGICNLMEGHEHGGEEGVHHNRY